MSAKKILVTGISGLIGRSTIHYLKNSGFEIYAFSNKTEVSDASVITERADLFDYQAVQSFIAQIKPTHLLHLAWKSTGNFNSNVNYDFISASINMLRAFAEQGGKKVAIAGTYVEYGHNDELLEEKNSPISPLYTYGKCKHHLHNIACSFCKSNDISLNWGRVFSVFGHDTDPRRLTAYAVNNLMQDKEIVIKSGSLLRDYIYSKDVAEAFVHLLCSPTSGPVNICTGIETSIRSYVLKIANYLGKEHLVHFVDQDSDQPRRVVGNNIRLIKEFGFTPRYSIDQALPEMLARYGYKGCSCR